MSTGNTFDTVTKSWGHARKVWRETRNQFPGGGVVTNVADWTAKGLIPAGTPCKWSKNADGGKELVCYTDAAIKTASDGAENVAALGINAYTLQDVPIKDGKTVGTATAVYDGEIYKYMLNADTAKAVESLVPGVKQV